MKRFAVNILTSTGMALVALAAIAAVNGAKFLLVDSVFQTLGANVVIHLGLLVTRKFESSYAALEAALDIAWVVLVLVAAGAVFGWYSSTPAWMLVVMDAAIYLAGVGLSMVRIREDLAEINRLLQKRK